MSKKWDPFYAKEPVLKPWKHLIGSRVIGYHPQNAYTGLVGTLIESYYKVGWNFRVELYKVRFDDGRVRIFESIKQA